MSGDELTVDKIKSRRMLYLILGTFSLLILGLIYAWSIFAAPIGKANPSYGPQLPLVFQVLMFAFCLSQLLGAQIIKRSSPKIAIIVAAVCMSGGFVLTALLAGINFWMLIIFYSLFVGTGCGIGYNALIAMVNLWFPDRVGMSSGILMMGFGVATLVFGTVANALFESGIAWTVVFIMIAVLAFIVMLLAAFIIKPAPKDIAARLGIVKASVGAKDSPTQQQSILKSKTFWLYSLWSVLIIAGGLTLIGNSRQGAEILQLQVSISAGFPALLVGLVSTMNGLGRIINGILFDKVGLVPIMLVSAVIAFLCLTGISLAFIYKIGPLYIASAILMALPYAAAPVLCASFARQRFGSQNYATNLGIVSLAIAAAAVMNIIIQAFLGSPNGENAPIIYAVQAGLVVVAFLGALVFSKVYRNDLTAIAKEQE
ncbi:MAG: MFS transporter [Actinomycetia bacterium]|nr:MFS transporter [Actinomycetes bacterium]